METQAMEPFLQEKERRFEVFPIKFPSLWKRYKAALASFWTADEVGMSKDIQQWRTELSEGERHVLMVILAFFATADGIVAENIVEWFSCEVGVVEAKFFYGFQAAMENVHAETYSMILEQLVPNYSARAALLDQSQTPAAVASKNRWALRWLSDESVFSLRLAAFAAVEGIFFSSSFAVIFWFKSRGSMPGLCFSNDLISRDEAQHTKFACELLRLLKAKPDEEQVQDIFREAVDIETNFAKESLSLGLVGLTENDMAQYIRFVADQLLRRMGYEPIYGASNPLPFMDMIMMQSRTNFFERQNLEYRMPGYGTLDYGAFTSEAFGND